MLTSSCGGSGGPHGSRVGSSCLLLLPLLRPPQRPSLPAAQEVNTSTPPQQAGALTPHASGASHQHRSLMYVSLQAGQSAAAPQAVLQGAGAGGSWGPVMVASRSPARGQTTAGAGYLQNTFTWHSGVVGRLSPCGRRPLLKGPLPRACCLCTCMPGLGEAGDVACVSKRDRFWPKPGCGPDRKTGLLTRWGEVWGCLITMRSREELGGQVPLRNQGSGPRYSWHQHRAQPEQALRFSHRVAVSGVPLYSSAKPGGSHQLDSGHCPSAQQVQGDAGAVLGCPGRAHARSRSAK